MTLHNANLSSVPILLVTSSHVPKSTFAHIHHSQRSLSRRWFKSISYSHPLIPQGALDSSRMCLHVSLLVWFTAFYRTNACLSVCPKSTWDNLNTLQLCHGKWLQHIVWFRNRCKSWNWLTVNSWTLQFFSQMTPKRCFSFSHHDTSTFPCSPLLSRLISWLCGSWAE